MRYGFTGSQKLPTVAQTDWLRNLLLLRAGLHSALHHGACIGSDEAAHFVGLECGVPIVVHPPKNHAKVALDVLVPRLGVTILAAKNYDDRNVDIVNDTDVLLATPKGPEVRRSGTWSTIRYALSLDRHVEICFPDGRVEER